MCSVWTSEEMAKGKPDGCPQSLKELLVCLFCSSFLILLSSFVLDVFLAYHSNSLVSCTIFWSYFLNGCPGGYSEPHKTI